MTTLMIVEDELLCLENLTQMPWESIGIKLIGTARSGNEAFNKIKQNPPDIVLTDIEMNDGNGFELVDKITYRLPNIKVIFLTAHNIFEYAQKAIKYKAFNFILKPINRQVLFDSVLDAKKAIEKENSEQNQYKKLLMDFTNCKYFLKDYFFSLISSNNIGTAKSVTNINENMNHFQTILLSQFDNNGGLQSIDFKIFTEIIAVLTPRGFNFIPFYEQNMLTYIIQSDKNDVVEKSIEAATIMLEYMKYSNDIKFTIAIGSAVKGINYIPFCVKRAQEAFKYRFSIGENEVIYIDDIEQNGFSMSSIDELRTMLIDSIKVINTEQVKIAIKEIFNNLQNSHASLDIAHRICLELVVTISITMAQLGVKADILFNKTDIWLMMKKYQTLTSLEDFISDISDTAISVINSNRKNKNNSIVNRAIELIENNIATDVSLETVAVQIPISATYLSTLFKNKTGISYKNYITQIRLEKAKELLINSDLPIYEIAMKIGYKDQRHFSTLFQSKTGLLPTEYKKQSKINYYPHNS